MPQGRHHRIVIPVGDIDEANSAAVSSECNLGRLSKWESVVVAIIEGYVGTVPTKNAIGSKKRAGFIEENIRTGIE